jgi:hypothetical protein
MAFDEHCLLNTLTLRQIHAGYHIVPIDVIPFTLFEELTQGHGKL